MDIKSEISNRKVISKSKKIKSKKNTKIIYKKLI